MGRQTEVVHLVSCLDDQPMNVTQEHRLNSALVVLVTKTDGVPGFVLINVD